MCVLRRILHNSFFCVPEGAGVGPTAWRLMHPTGREYLLGVQHEIQSPDELTFEPFIVTAADAYCFRAALKPTTRAVRALRSMGLLNGKYECFESRFKVNFEQINEKIGRRVKQFEMASFEAYFLSPLMSPRPKPVRIPRAKDPKPPKVESPCDVSVMPEGDSMPATEIAEPEPADTEQPSTMVVEANAYDDDDATTQVAEIVTWMTPAGYEASLPADAQVEEVVDEPEYAVGDLVVVQSSSAVGAPGRYSEGIPSARVVEYLGNGIYEVAATYRTVEAIAGRKRRVDAMRLSPMEEDGVHQDDAMSGLGGEVKALNQGTSKRQCILTRQRKAVERAETANRIESNVLLSAAMAITRLRS